jgi:chemotaxis methyl-accepting protein methylase
MDPALNERNGVDLGRLDLERFDPESFDQSLIERAQRLFGRPGGVSSQARFCLAAEKRRELLDLTLAEYQNLLDIDPHLERDQLERPSDQEERLDIKDHKDPRGQRLQKYDGAREWLEIWNLWGQELEERFFRHPAQLDVLAQIVQEWVPFAPARRLKILVLGSGKGYEACSLAIAFFGLGLKAKGWEIFIQGLELVPNLVAAAKAAIFPALSLEGLPRDLTRRFFEPRAGGWHFREGIARFQHETLNIHRLAEPPEYLWGADVILARGLAWDTPDDELVNLAGKVKSLLAEDSLLLTGPGEFWPGLEDLALEERDGVTYYRQSTGRHRPKPGQKIKTLKTPPDSTPRMLSLQWAAEEKLSPAGPALATPQALEAARELLVELIHEEAAAGYLRPASLRLIAEVEEALNRPQAAAATREVVNFLQPDDQINQPDSLSASPGAGANSGSTP